MVDSEAKFLTLHRLARGRPRLVPAVREVSRSQELKLMNYTRVKLDIQWLSIETDVCMHVCMILFLSLCLMRRDISIIARAKCPDPGF